MQRIDCEAGEPGAPGFGAITACTESASRSITSLAQAAAWRPAAGVPAAWLAQIG